MTGGSGSKIQHSEYKADVIFSQAAPVQNTWYTLFDTKKNVRLYSVGVNVADTDETLEARLTIDGQTFSGNTTACTANTTYSIYMNPTFGQFKISANIMAGFSTYLEGRSIKIEIRKTTAAGAGTITGRVSYGQIT